MSINFTDFFNHVNWFLKDIPESGSRGNAFARLPKDICLNIVNIITDALCRENHQRFIQEYPLTIIHDPATGYNTDSTGLYLTLPENVCRAIAVRLNDTEEYQNIADSTDLNRKIRRYNDNTIYNYDGWNNGDTIYLSAVIFPAHVVYTPAVTTPTPIPESWTDIDMPRECFDLLSMSVINYVYAQAGQEPTVFFTQRFEELKKQWKLDTGKISESLRIKNKRSGIGGSYGRI